MSMNSDKQSAIHISQSKHYHISDNPLHILRHSLQKQSMEHVIIKSRVVLAGSLAIRREGNFKQLRLHRQ